ncbi:protein amnionless [Condylostylus longicornis]|uniref:protein amnionless n=1 Tax=Condylostylus longicornis TaxID=2530218 RepID=UPI00244E1EB0|nr:protein amnionless [Condylostylus longicornis]
MNEELVSTLGTYVIDWISVICSKVFLNSANNQFLKDTFWERNSPPCEYDKIIFPKVYPAALILPKQLDIDSIILPREGVLILGELSNFESLVSFTNTDQKDMSKNKNCKNVNNAAILKFDSNYTKFWFDPQSWKSSENISKATPDLERIPCSYDTVIFPNSGVVSVNFENINSLSVNGIEMGGENTTWEIFQHDLYSDVAHIMFQEALDFTVKFNKFLDKDEHCNCHDFDLYFDYEKRVCSHVKKKCEINYPKCLDPIKPFGYCCDICGSILTMDIDDCKSFDLERFKNFIKLEIKNQGLDGYLDYHVSKIYNGRYFIQLIVLDKNDYDEMSTYFIKHLNKTILQENYSLNMKVFSLSGMKSSFVFARFDNNQGEIEIPENLNRPPIHVEGLYETNNSDVNLDVSRSFDNPMFDEKLEVPNSSNIENISMASDSTELTMICLDDN